MSKQKSITGIVDHFNVDPTNVDENGKPKQVISVMSKTGFEVQAPTIDDLRHSLDDTLAHFNSGLHELLIQATQAGLNITVSNVLDYNHIGQPIRGMGKYVQEYQIRPSYEYVRLLMDEHQRIKEGAQEKPQPQESADEADQNQHKPGCNLTTVPEVSSCNCFREEHPLLDWPILETAAKAVEDSATVWTGFAPLDAKTCISTALATLSEQTAIAYQRDHEKAVRAIEVAAEFTPELKEAMPLSPAAAIGLLAQLLSRFAGMSPDQQT